jgi:hypothetical protein
MVRVRKEETMQYLLLMRSDETAEVRPEDDCRRPGPGADALAAWLAEMERRGVRLLAGERLDLDVAGKSVRERKGELVVTDGPFAETKELVAGFVLVECASIDEAVEIASLHPSARSGMVEVRQVFEG